VISRHCSSASTAFYRCGSRPGWQNPRWPRASQALFGLIAVVVDGSDCARTRIEANLVLETSDALNKFRTIDARACWMPLSRIFWVNSMASWR
jgi:hypothetical protein